MCGRDCEAIPNKNSVSKGTYSIKQSWKLTFSPTCHSGTAIILHLCCLQDPNCLCGGRFLGRWLSLDDLLYMHVALGRLVDCNGFQLKFFLLFFVPTVKVLFGSEAFWLHA